LLRGGTPAIVLQKKRALNDPFLKQTLNLLGYPVLAKERLSRLRLFNQRQLQKLLML